MDLSLVILAAGAGSRFGGDKPLAAVGPNGESLFEYSVRDAVNAGFNHVVFVVNSKQNTDVFLQRLAIYKNRLKIRFAVQNNDDGIDSSAISATNRTKPWGTGHAILTCRTLIESPFVAINADDYYGVSNFQLIGNFLKHNLSTPDMAALPGYPLKNTLSSSGGVNRGICTVKDDGYLQSIHEWTNISVNSGILYADNPPDGADNLSLDTQVSMNFWGFYPAFFALLKTAFTHFLETTPHLETDEFYIPAAVNFLINSGLLRVNVFPSNEQWSGVTYARDIASVRESIKNLPAI